eukprot:1157203-Pelagomonas_calceolata.AAC.7
MVYHSAGKEWCPCMPEMICNTFNLRHEQGKALGIDASMVALVKEEEEHQRAESIMFQYNLIAYLVLINFMFQDASSDAQKAYGGTTELKVQVPSQETSLAEKPTINILASAAQAGPSSTKEAGEVYLWDIGIER